MNPSPSRVALKHLEASSRSYHDFGIDGAVRTIASEIIARGVNGESRGWQGGGKGSDPPAVRKKKAQELVEIAKRLAPFNIGYTDDFYGTWSYVQGGTPREFDHLLR